jgi:ribose transport system substrate-binding protein
VPQSTGNYFADQAYAGCQAAEKELKGSIQCIYVGPQNPGDPNSQIAILEDLISKKIDGIAVAPTDPTAVTHALRMAKLSGIPVVTWDTDLNQKDHELRLAFVGTSDFQVGVGLASLVRQMKPKGGSICIEVDFVGVEAFAKRVEGLRDTLAGKRSAEASGVRLTGQNGWFEPKNCPLYVNNNLEGTYEQADRVLQETPKLGAFVMTGSALQSDADSYEKFFERYKEQVTSGALALIGAGTAPTQISLLDKGLSTAQVGRRPFEMAYKSMYILRDVKEGRNPPQDDETNLGLDVCREATSRLCSEQPSCPDSELVCGDNTCRPECK